MLKPDRHINPYGTEINFTFNGTADSGTIMVYGAAGSGAAVADENAGTVVVGPASPSGATPVAGLLLHPFVAYNALLHRNWYKVTQYPGDKATLVRSGWVTTDMVVSGAVPAIGKTAYLGANGKVTDATGGPRVGQFQSQLNEQGFCRLLVDLPQ